MSNQKKTNPKVIELVFQVVLKIINQKKGGDYEGAYPALFSNQQRQ
ncbi:hypothetical protein X474_20175 [Dethiosulfatarculus sandiegensis]|uniref:Uncharacterized protein n=1 Tax=Dethiosulfatarculus sandiegensis TaxID=1429043 RepID=A0A0D2J9A8_9BACT|nr:hypothetical protein X474_20175 [Dethiosulfatarculus sandiegensis]